MSSFWTILLLFAVFISITVAVSIAVSMYIGKLWDGDEDEPVIRTKRSEDRHENP